MSIQVHEVFTLYVYLVQCIEHYTTVADCELIYVVIVHIIMLYSCFPSFKHMKLCLQYSVRQFVINILLHAWVHYNATRVCGRKSSKGRAFTGVWSFHKLPMVAWKLHAFQ